MRVVCLCAGWCRTCDGFRAEVDRLAASEPALEVRWLDIEDEADLIGDLDIETFPTILVADGTKPVFFGPILPSYEHLKQVATRPGGMRIADPDVHALAQALADESVTRRD